MTWLDVCNDKNLQDLPYKIELNKAGQIIMSPTRNRHGYYAAKIARILSELMGRGETLVELAVETEDSTKVADVAWASPEVFRIIQDQISSSIAPEICVEVKSPTNSESEIAFKRSLYLKAGAKEYWVCNEAGEMQFFNTTAQLEKSAICPNFPAKLS